MNIRAQVRFIVGRIHVATPDREVLRNFWNRMKKDKNFSREDRKRVYRMALEAHNQNRDMYYRVMSGHWS